MESEFKELPFKLDIKRVVSCALVLASVTILAVIWLVEQSLVPHVKADEFIFTDGESIPTNSAYYLLYNETYEDVEFDASLFAMDAIGEYDVEVPFSNNTYTFKVIIEDKNEPVITFQETDGTTVLNRIDGELQAKSLFTIRDASDVTIEEITPALDEIQDGQQEVCVTVRDAFDHIASKCEKLNIKLTDYATTSAKANNVEEIISNYIKNYNLNEENFGFFYYDKADQETYIYNGDGVFAAASTIKVPLNMVYYDKLHKQEISKDMHYTLLANDVEAGAGDTITDYRINEAIPLTYLLEQSIINSDNTATNVLIRNLGSFQEYREDVAQYSDAEIPANFSTENVLTPKYMMDVLIYLYDHEDEYSELIEDMKQASAGMYLQSSSDAFEIAQKYGAYNAILHANGIVYTPSPYIVGIYTDNVAQSEDMISSLNKDLIDYQLQK